MLRDAVLMLGPYVYFESRCPKAYLEKTWAEILSDKIREPGAVSTVARLDPSESFKLLNLSRKGTQFYSRWTRAKSNYSIPTPACGSARNFRCRQSFAPPKTLNLVELSIPR